MAEVNRHQNQNAKPALTQKGFSHVLSRLMMLRITKVRARTDNQKSAGERSMSKINGPSSQNIWNPRSHFGRADRALYKSI